MIRRQLVLITNPGILGENNYAKHAQDVIDRWEYFFKSPIGGFWEEGEIIKISEVAPIGTGRMDVIMSQLDLDRCDYSLIIFCGHGLRTKDGEDCIQLPVRLQNNFNLYPVNRLKGITQNKTQIPPHIRRTIILDACRKIQPITAKELFEQKEFAGGKELDGEMCRNYYNEVIMRQEPHVELLQSTDKGNLAYTSTNGSVYGDTVMRYIKDQSSFWESTALTNRYGKCDVKMRKMQDEVSANIVGQMPQFWSSNEKTEGYPFAAYHVYVPRTLEQIVEDIDFKGE